MKTGVLSQWFKTVKMKDFKKTLDKDRCDRYGVIFDGRKKGT